VAASVARLLTHLALLREAALVLQLVAHRAPEEALSVGFLVAQTQLAADPSPCSRRSSERRSGAPWPGRRTPGTTRRRLQRPDQLIDL